MPHIYFDSGDNCLVLLDQRLLPGQEQWFRCAKTADVVYALQKMVVRGAPAIGVSAAYGCVLAALEVEGRMDWREILAGKTDEIAMARPTAANLVWAVKRMRDFCRDKEFSTPAELAAMWLEEARRIHREDVETNKAIGINGRDLLQDGETVMTHCNAGALATGGYGTALGVVRAAVEQGKNISVIANETRPFLQGARLTAYELAEDNISVRVACDNACAFLMQRQMVHKVLVGADRIAANGDTANKIGTYALAVLAQRHNIPFYVAAPLSTFDFSMATGKEIPIEDREPQEVRYISGQLIVPEDVDAYNFAFDVTPYELISGIITENGVLTPPLSKAG